MADWIAFVQELETALATLPDEEKLKKECGPAFSIIHLHPGEVQRLAHARLHTYPFKDVPECWRQLYCEASLWLVLHRARHLARVAAGQEGNGLDEVVQILDMALIMTGAPHRMTLIQTLLQRLSEGQSVSEEPARKRQRLVTEDRHGDHSDDIPGSFPPMVKDVVPPLKHPIARRENIGLTEFQNYMIESHATDDNGPLPIIITNGMSDWPACKPDAWADPRYLISKTIGGRRIIPVEIGQSYTDAGWGQKLQTMRQFMEENMFVARVPADKRGYLAQHDLFMQTPDLKRDILIPDYCYSEPPKRYPPDEKSDDSHDTDTSKQNSAQINEPSINAWFGPAHTVSPAHTDPHHNILAQVVGHKYVRLFAPSQKSRMYTRGWEGGINMDNTSRVDVGAAMRILEGWHGWDNTCQVDKAAFSEEFPDFADAQYLEGILAPGECLYIPEGWWHYVRSLSPSFSVSFWWD